MNGWPLTFSVNEQPICYKPTNSWRLLMAHDVRTRRNRELGYPMDGEKQMVEDMIFKVQYREAVGRERGPAFLWWCGCHWPWTWIEGSAEYYEHLTTEQWWEL